MLATLKETPLVDVHKTSGAKLVDFAGWYMPVRYNSTITEHLAVRNSVGIFDVSHMGEFVVSGDHAKDFVQYVVANDVEKLTAPNCALYTQFLNERGGTVDDLLVYRRETDYLLVVNASNIDKDWQWLNQHISAFPGVKLKDESPETALIAVQGPKAVDVLKSMVGAQIAKLPSFHLCNETTGGIKIAIARTGYTGEDGFEIFARAEDAAKVWELIMKAGQPYGIAPIGLGARDTLRLEACLPLYGHELDDSTSPLEAGYGWTVKLDKGDFIGRAALLKQKTEGLPKQLVGLVTEGQALPRQGYPVKLADKQIGVVTSGSQGIFVSHPIALAYVPPELAKIGQELAVEIRSVNVPARVVPVPFYKRKRN